MAKSSRNARQKSRVRRNVTLLTRQLKQVHDAYTQSHITLLAVLAQAGPVTVTMGTFQQVAANLRGLNWTRSFVNNEFVIQLQEIAPHGNESELLPKPDGGDETTDQQSGQASSGTDSPPKASGPSSISEFARAEAEAVPGSSGLSIAGGAD